MSSSNAGYTPLIIAIKERNVETVRQLLEGGVDANEKDGIEKWVPMKWATYVYQYSPGHNDADNQAKMQKIVELLYNAKARNDFDGDNEDSYDFSPLTGGRRVKKSRKTRKSRKSRKSIKSHKKGKRASSTKRRKHMKK